MPFLAPTHIKEDLLFALVSTHQSWCQHTRVLSATRRGGRSKPSQRQSISRLPLNGCIVLHTVQIISSHTQTSSHSFSHTILLLSFLPESPPVACSLESLRQTADSCPRSRRRRGTDPDVSDSCSCERWPPARPHGSCKWRSSSRGLIRWSPSWVGTRRSFPPEF